MSQVRPIIFSGPMVLALLSGRKTQTRRLATSPLRRCEVGDVLWVRESLRAEELSRPPATRAATARERRASGRTSTLVLDEDDGRDGVRYAADDAWVGIENTSESGEAWSALFHYGCRNGSRPAGLAGNLVPSIHAPRWASRLTLVVEAVRVERLQAISREDCAAEGHRRADQAFPEEVHLDAARDWYSDLWDELHVERGTRWADDPAVVALTFRVEHRNVDR